MMRLGFRSILLLPLVIGGIACATLFSSSPNSVTFQSDTPGADIYINGTLRGKTPLTLELDHKTPITVTFKQPGRQDFTADISTHVRGGFVVLDVLGGLVPVIIDAATGEWKTLSEKVVSANLAPTK